MAKALSPLVLALSGQALAISGGEIAGLYEEALRSFNEKDCETASTHLKNILQFDGMHLASHVLLGKCYLREGDGGPTVPPC